jgi:hypothetical protein
MRSSFVYNVAFQKQMLVQFNSPVTLTGFPRGGSVWRMQASAE